MGYVQVSETRTRMSHIPPFMKRKFAAPRPVQVAPQPEPQPVNVEEAIEKMEEARLEVPKWNPKMKKDALLKIAKKAGLKVSKENTKAEIIAQLQTL